MKALETLYHAVDAVLWKQQVKATQRMNQIQTRLEAIEECGPVDPKGFRAYIRSHAEYQQLRNEESDLHHELLAIRAGRNEGRNIFA